MFSKARALGLALAAVLAMSALVASAAQAVPKFTGFDEATGTHTHTTLDGTTEAGSVEKYTSGPIGTIECHGHFTGTSLTGEETELTINPEYTHPGNDGVHATGAPDCVTNIGGTKFTTHVNMNGCHYQFHSGHKLAIDEYEGTADVVCGTGGNNGPITITITKATEAVTKCTVKIAAQNGLGPIIYRNETAASPTAVTLEWKVGHAGGTTGTSIAYTSEGGILNCGVSNGAHTGGTYTSEVTLKGFDTEGNQIDVEVSGE